MNADERRSAFIRVNPRYESTGNEARFDVPGFVVVRSPDPLEFLYRERTGSQRHRHLNDHGRAAVLARLCTLALLAAPTHGWLQAGATLSARFRCRTQHTCVPDRNSCNRQNFTTLRCVSMHCCFSADGHGLRTRFRLELSEHSAIRRVWHSPLRFERNRSKLKWLSLTRRGSTFMVSASLSVTGQY